jgi:hypothetical protein
MCLFWVISQNTYFVQVFDIWDVINRNYHYRCVLLSHSGFAIMNKIYITFPGSIVSQNDVGCGTSHTNTKTHIHLKHSKNIERPLGHFALMNILLSSVYMNGHYFTTIYICVYVKCLYICNCYHVSKHSNVYSMQLFNPNQIPPDLVM